MWKEITDAQRDGRAWYVSRPEWPEPITGGWVEGWWIDPNGELLPAPPPTYYWDFGLDTPLPPPPKGDE